MSLFVASITVAISVPSMSTFPMALVAVAVLIAISCAGRWCGKDTGKDSPIK
jgi:hypothetical protein